MVISTIQYSVAGHLERVINCFRQYLYLPDATPLFVTLAAVAANYMRGDPVWFLLVGGPGSGKTEVINSILGLPRVYATSTINESGLLSGTPLKEKSKNASGGLLREVGEFGIVLLKDFTSVLSMHRDQRGAVIAALREIFDGSWTRRIGGEGGTELHWHGKLGFISACTDDIETHHAVISSMGDRYMRLRMPDINAKEQGRRSQRNKGREAEMRKNLEAAVKELFSNLDLTTEVDISDVDQSRINALATFTALARSHVERSGVRREVEFVPDSERPARLSKCLLYLLAGALKIGCGPELAFDCVRQVAFDSIPKVRLQVIEKILECYNEPTTENLVDVTCLPEVTIRRTLEDLKAHRVVESWSPQANTSPPIVWKLNEGAPVFRKGNGQVWNFTGDAAELLSEAGIL